MEVKVGCPYADKCVDADTGKCNSCLNNEKRSYYRPSDYWYPWYYEPYPCTPWITWLTGGTGDDLGMPTTSYYQTA